MPYHLPANPAPLHLALYQPDMPANVGNMLRLCACLDAVCHIIEPCGFPLDDKRMKRAGMDYMAQVTLVRHASWQAFHAAQTQAGRRILLLSSKATHTVWTMNYQADDVLLLGQESAGVPPEVEAACHHSLTIPMKAGVRCLNVSSAAAIALGEAVRQLRA